MEEQIVNIMKKLFLKHIDIDILLVEDYDITETFYELVIEELVNTYFNKSYKKLVEAIGTYKVLKYKAKVSSCSHHDFFNRRISPEEEEGDEEMYFYYCFITDYLLNKYIWTDIDKYFKKKITEWNRLHYNRYLQQSNLPNEICSKIREYL